MEPILGEIRAVGFNFAPRGWAVCDGSLLQIRSNTALFSLLGIQYGGNGSSTFALPDLRGRAAVQTGQGPGLSNYAQGQIAGTENVTLLPAQLPAHTHVLSGPNTGTILTNSGMTGGSGNPVGMYLANSSENQYSEDAGETMKAGAVTGTTTIAGDSQAHANMMPYLAVYYIIALQGIFPQRP